MLLPRVGIVLALLLAGSPAAAREMKLAIYDDEISCPGGCDAHVVMNPADNGTVNAHRPGTWHHPVACTRGESCEICFSNRPDSCMKATYRGSGPPEGTFDFTPAFYDQNCPLADVPTAFKAQCATLDLAATGHGDDRRIGRLGSARFAAADHPEHVGFFPRSLNAPRPSSTPPWRRPATAR